MLQLLTAYTDPERHNALRHRQTDRQQYRASSRSYNPTHNVALTTASKPKYILVRVKNSPKLENYSTKTVI